MKEHKKRFRIEFTVNVRNEGFDREDWDWSDENIKSFALQELTCMSPFPEDITFSEVEDTWHTGTPTEDGWYLLKYEDGFYCANYWNGNGWKNQWCGTLLKWQKIEETE